MTPQLMQAIKLLQLSSLDLAAYVEGELERNPLLERANDDDPPVPGAEASGTAPEPSEDGPATADWMDADLETSRSSMEQGLGTELENVFPDDGGEKASRSSEAPPPAYSEWSGAGSAGNGEDYNLEAFVSAETTLADHLAEQMALAISRPAGRMIGQYLIDMVDEAGYLTGDLNTVAEKLGARLTDVELVLAVLQTFDPLGVCARNLTECLGIQLRERDRFDPAMRVLVEHLDLLAKRDLAGLRRLCGVNDEDLADMIAEIRSLNPKPGLAFGSTMVQPIVPDVFVRAAPDGTWQVELNSDTLPKVLLNQRYYAKVAKRVATTRTSLYRRLFQTATWLVRALDQRAKTISRYRVKSCASRTALSTACNICVRSIQDRRRCHGMHESTVSRVTANKYMATSRGIFELKYFFTSAIAAANGGEAHSAEAVRHRIRQLIEDESAQDVLSDDTIVEKLRAAGIEIARRTVAKYREAMRIPSSVQRRREKLAAGA